MRSPTLLYLSVTVVLACSPDERARDSRGGAAEEAGFRVDSVPLLDIAGTVTADSAAFLLAVSGVRLSNGVIVVADMYDAAVRFFDASGRLIRKVGRRGEGPGEFQNVAWLGRCAGADSVFVWDAALYRLTVLDSTGVVGRMSELSGSPTMLACSRSGTLAAFMGERSVTRSGPGRWDQRYSGQLWLLDADGDTMRSLGGMPMGELRPLGRVTRVAMTDDRLYVGTADSAFIDVYGLDGWRSAMLEVGFPARAPTRRDLDRAVEVMVRPFTGRDARENARSMLLEIPMPDLVPPYAGLFADPAGTLWVSTPAPENGATQLRAIAPDGRILGDVRLPVELDVFEVGRDYILGAYEDDAGEQHVAIYRLRRGA